MPAVGVVLVVVGVIFLVIPGPGLPIVVLGGALLARESHGVAHALDWSEVKVRAFLRPMIRAWQKRRA